MVKFLRLPIGLGYLELISSLADNLSFFPNTSFTDKPEKVLYASENAGSQLWQIIWAAKKWNQEYKL